MPKFYQTPGGTISTAEKQWKEDMKAEGLDPKAYDGRRTFDVPIKASELAEFLTFHNVNVVNPQGSTPAPEVAGSTNPPPPGELSAAPSPSTTVSLDELFAAAPIRQKISLAVAALDAVDARITELGG
jgi:hypothetical protein